MLARHGATQRPAPAVLMLSGAQGIGKSHAMRVLAGHDSLKVCTLAIVDFYLDQAKRLALGRQVHPLCATRGTAGLQWLPLPRAACLPASQTPRGQAGAMVDRWLAGRQW